MIRFLDRCAVLAAGGGDFDAAIADVREALTALRSGDAEMPAEVSVALGGDAQNRAYALPARIGSAAGVKWTAHAPAGDSVTLVNDAATGALLGVVESRLLTRMRTAAVTSLMIDHLGRPPRHVAVLGAGGQAETHLRLLAHRYTGLAQVTLWNRTAASAQQLVAKFPERPWPLSVAPSLALALADADIVITCTNAAEPFLGPTSIRPGRAVIQIGYHEVNFDAIDRADAILVDAWGEFRLTSAKSLFQMHRAGRFDASRVTADLAALTLAGRGLPADAAVYVSCFGLNVFDLAIAARVLRTDGRNSTYPAPTR